MPILLGGNPATTSENNLNKSWLQRTADMFSDERLSVHNCHGLGQQQSLVLGFVSYSVDGKLTRMPTIKNTPTGEIK
nr:MAG TPA: hypothetical protein [Caudoviricetes sp.]